jgi:hypothetical protein
MRNGKYGTRGTTGNEESASCSSHYGFEVPNPSLSANPLRIKYLIHVRNLKATSDCQRERRHILVDQMRKHFADA